jgi:hypothetical protein
MSDKEIGLKFVKTKEMSANINTNPEYDDAPWDAIKLRAFP